MSEIDELVKRLRAECSHALFGKCSARTCHRKNDDGSLVQPIEFIGCVESRAADALEAVRSTIRELTEGGVGLIAAERTRQIEQEGWTPEHDDEHADSELALAACAYAMRAAWPTDALVPRIWPWKEEWWKPKDRISNLVKAGALIAAEIDRLHRAALSGGSAT